MNTNLLQRIIDLESKSSNKHAKSGSSGTYGQSKGSKGSNEIDSLYEVKFWNHKRNNSDAVNSIISNKGILNGTFDVDFEDTYHKVNAKKQVK